MRYLRVAISVAGFAATLATTVAAQPLVLTGTGDPNMDVPAAQAAVDQGGRVVMKGHFLFRPSPNRARRSDDQPDGHTVQKRRDLGEP